LHSDPLRLRRFSVTGRRSRAVACGSAAALVLAALPAFAGASALVAGATAARPGTVQPIPSVVDHILVPTTHAQPISTTDCQAAYGISCYSPVQYRTAYNLNPLYKKGITGAGKTIVIVDSYGSPTIQADLDAFDAQWGFPNTTVQVVREGAVPPFDPTNSTMDGWAYETSLDVEYAHSVAPGAHIVLLETSVAETEGVTGFPQMMAGEKSLIDRGIGDVISQSFSATENTFPGFGKRDYSSLLDLRYAYEDAAAHGVTVLAAAGDTGAAGDESDGETLYPYPVVDWPSSDPLVTSVGGSQLYLDDAGNRLKPDSVWNDGYGAGGGGLSAVFSRPWYQAGVASTVGNHRGTPDISMSAAVNGGAWVYASFDPSEAGWGIVGGTSEATPLFSGIVALADQVAGHRLGNINSALYLLGALSQHSKLPTGIVDITSGDNSYGGVTGYNATPGYDLAAGWGTINAAAFVPALARTP
jgi:subtilase family serine protease